MLQLGDALVDLIRSITLRPEMFSTTPEMADGLVVGLAWVAVSQATQLPIERCAHDVRAMVQEATRDICKSDCYPIMLCEASLDPHCISFDAFREHGSKFVELLRHRVKSANSMDAGRMRPTGE